MLSGLYKGVVNLLGNTQTASNQSDSATEQQMTALSDNSTTTTNTTTTVNSAESGINGTTLALTTSDDNTTENADSDDLHEYELVENNSDTALLTTVSENTTQKQVLNSTSNATSATITTSNNNAITPNNPVSSSNRKQADQGSNNQNGSNDRGVADIVLEKPACGQNYPITDNKQSETQLQDLSTSTSNTQAPENIAANTNVISSATIQEEMDKKIASSTENNWAELTNYYDASPVTTQLESHLEKNYKNSSEDAFNYIMAIPEQILYELFTSYDFKYSRGRLRSFFETVFSFVDQESYKTIQDHIYDLLCKDHIYDLLCKNDNIHLILFAVNKDYSINDTFLKSLKTIFPDKQTEISTIFNSYKENQNKEGFIANIKADSQKIIDSLIIQNIRRLITRYDKNESDSYFKYKCISRIHDLTKKITSEQERNLILQEINNLISPPTSPGRNPSAMFAASPSNSNNSSITIDTFFLSKREFNT
ncbi:MAG: hypothetical protein KIT27_06795 [Legionellales bacterium]|nr:hypothetical protein [Legionellales bacterium]